jgi:hypothetical protein
LVGTASRIVAAAKRNFPSRAQISPAFRAFVDLAREKIEPNKASSKRRTKS